MAIVPAGLTSKSALKRAQSAATAGYISPTPTLQVTVPKSSPTPFGSVPYGPSVPGTLTVPKSSAATITGTPLSSGTYTGVPSSTGGTPSTLAVQGWTPEQFQAQIDADPVYQAALSGSQAAKNMARNTLTSQIHNAIIQAGYDPSGMLTGDLSQYAGDVDPTTLAAAGQNQFSTKAQLDRAYNQNLADLPYQLAARGASRSGAAASSGSRLTSDYQLQSHNALTDLLSSIRGYVTDNLGAGVNADQQLANQRAQVATRLSMLPGSAPTDAQLASAGQNGQTVDVTGGGGGATTKPPATGPVSWGGQTFTTKAALSRWLSARGASYAQWALNHRDADARLS